LLLDKYSDKNYPKTISTLQILYTIATILSSGGTEISLDDIYQIFTEKKLSPANYIATITSTSVRLLFIYDRVERRIRLCSYKKLFEIFEKHKDLLKQYVPSKQPVARMKEVIERTKEGSTSKEIVFHGLQKVLQGHGSFVKETDGNPRIFINAPKSIIGSTINCKRRMVLFCLAGLREVGINEVGYSAISRMLEDNRMGRLQVPRDLSISNLFIHDKEKKGFSSNQSYNSKELVAELLGYKVGMGDITSKMEEIIPVMKSVISENQRGYIERTKLAEKFREKGIFINLPRDIPRVFGFFYMENFYFSVDAFKTAFKLLSTK
jgi:hypothetical protein